MLSSVQLQPPDRLFIIRSFLGTCRFLSDAIDFIVSNHCVQEPYQTHSLGLPRPCISLCPSIHCSFCTDILSDINFFFLLWFIHPSVFQSITYWCGPCHPSVHLSALLIYLSSRHQRWISIILSGFVFECCCSDFFYLFFACKLFDLVNIKHMRSK